MCTCPRIIDMSIYRLVSKIAGVMSNDYDHFGILSYLCYSSKAGSTVRIWCYLSRERMRFDTNKKK